MNLSSDTLRDLESLAKAARQVGEDSVTVPFQDGTVTFVFAPKESPADWLAKHLRLQPYQLAFLRKHTLLFPGLHRRA